MKIAIINLTGGSISGGYKRFLINVVPRLAQHNKIKSLLCVYPRTVHADRWFKPMEKVEFLSCEPFRLVNYRLKKNLRLELSKFSPDLVFVPIARRFDFPGVPVVHMVQNVFPFMWQSVKGLPLAEIIRLHIQCLEAKEAFHNTDQIIVNSNFVKDILINRFKVGEQKISLIYFGKESTGEDKKRPINLPVDFKDGFLFTCGSIEPYRGLEDLIGALRYLKNDFPELKVVVAGGTRPATSVYYRKLLKLCKLYNLSSSVIWAGQLAPDELVWCYQNCAAFIMTSRMESFGMVGLEAMANGCLCIASDNSPLPEIFADSALYYPLNDSYALSKIINRVLNFNNEMKLKMANKSFFRAKDFSWDEAADELVREFEAAVKHK